MKTKSVFAMGRILAKAGLLLLIALFTGTLFAQTSGGPDAYGYTWKNNLAPGGPVYNWKEIKNIGTQINAGFTDDNQQGPFNIGWNFHFYWANYGSMWLGSNGCLSFQSNAALPSAPFPLLPNTAVPNNYLAALSCDLTFIDVGTNLPVPGATAFYWTNNTDSMIFQYDSVPYWAAAPANYDGRYTFQIILSGVDSSITYQYKLTQAGTVAYAMANEGLSTGIENSTGQIGLQVLTNVFPTANTAVKFYYPNPVTYQVFDATPAWNQNNDNGGFFVSANGSQLKLSTDVLNSGNQPLSDIFTSGRILNSASVAVWDTFVKVSSLPAGADSMFIFPKNYTANTAGTFTYRTITTLVGDVNSANDITNVEMVVVDTTQTNIPLSYVTATTPVTAVSWGGTGGQGIYVEPPFYPTTINSLDFMVARSGTNGYHLVQILDDDGPNGTPGTVLYLDSVAASAAVIGSYNNVPVASTIVILSGGVYIGWLENGDDSSALGTDATLPLSNRNYEIIGAWSSYRNNAINDLMIRMNISNYYFGTITSGTSEDACPSTASGTATVSVNSGTAPPYSYLWSAGAQTTAIATGLVAGDHTVTITDSLGIVRAEVVKVYSNIAVTAVSTASVTCFGGNNGASMATIGGTGPYTYLWSNGQTDQTATGLAIGIYNVTASNMDGCTNIATDTIFGPTAVTNTLSVTSETCVGANGTATSAVSGGTTPYSYLWSNLQTTATATGLVAGSYTVGITDGNSCTSSATTTITNIPFVVSTTSLVPSSCSGNSGSATAMANSGGTSPYTYLWTAASQTGQTATGLSGGSYTVTITDAAGCTKSASATITTIPFASSSAMTPTSCYNSSDGVANSVPLAGGTSPYTYSWTPTGQVTQVATGLAAGTYTVLTIDATGCTSINTITVTSPPVMSVNVTSQQPATWPTLANGSAVVAVTNGTSPYSYVWTPSVSNTNTATGLTGGSYSVCAIDMFGCTACTSVNIIVNGVNEIYTGASVAISPNPFSSSAFVKVDFVNPTHNDLLFTIFDVYGREVKSIDLKEYKGATIDFTLNRGYEIPNGMYFYRLEDDKGILATGKLLVQ